MAPDDNTKSRPVRQFDRKKPTPPNLFTTFRLSAGFLIIMGLLSFATGVVLFVPFHNKFSKLMLLSGFVLVFVGYGVKLLDICITLIRGKS